MKKLLVLFVFIAACVFSQNIGFEDRSGKLGALRIAYPKTNGTIEAPRDGLIREYLSYQWYTVKHLGEDRVIRWKDSSASSSDAYQDSVVAAPVAEATGSVRTHASMFLKTPMTYIATFTVVARVVNPFINFPPQGDIGISYYYRNLINFGSTRLGLRSYTGGLTWRSMLDWSGGDWNFSNSGEKTFSNFNRFIDLTWGREATGQVATIGYLYGSWDGIEEPVFGIASSYWNGSSFEYTPQPMPTAVPSYAYIGAHGAGDALAYFEYGIVNLRIYNRILTASEIAEIPRWRK